jgi:toxin ParE1/3/4
VKPLLVSAQASSELAEAVRWYEERRPGWGAKLFDAVAHVFDLIRKWAHREKATRPPANYSSAGFPYVVAYRVRPSDVYVVAVAHAKRRPGYWKNRP